MTALSVQRPVSSICCVLAAMCLAVSFWSSPVGQSCRRADDVTPQRRYTNQLSPISNPQPLLADYPEFVQPIKETARFEAPVLIGEEGADLSVRAWPLSYNARGIIEAPNRLRGDKTPLIVVHPWGIDDGQGWNMPQPAGVALQCIRNADIPVRDFRHPRFRFAAEASPS